MDDEGDPLAYIQGLEQGVEVAAVFDEAIRTGSTNGVECNGPDITQRCPLVVATVASLPARAGLIAAAGRQRVFSAALCWSLGRLSCLSTRQVRLVFARTWLGWVSTELEHRSSLS